MHTLGCELNPMTQKKYDKSEGIISRVRIYKDSDFNFAYPLLLFSLICPEESQAARRGLLGRNRARSPANSQRGTVSLSPTAHEELSLPTAT